MKVKIKNCPYRTGADDDDAEDHPEEEDGPIIWSRSPQGYQLHFEASKAESGLLQLISPFGQIVWQQPVALQAGSNEVLIPAIVSGIAIGRLLLPTQQHVTKLHF